MKIRVLFVCMGNICRSPIAHGVFEHLVLQSGLADRIEVDSAGTHAYHVGELPDSRARRTAKARGLDLSSQRARHATPADLQHFDYVLVMDEDNLAHMRRLGEAGQRLHLSLLMTFAQQHQEKEVPDPYYGGEAGFERVMDMIEDASAGLLAHIRQAHGLTD
ncbi:protein-tyrosine phosphatase [Ectothiorhodospira magna]|uniref:protein-tyrosine-phosphatase n=1 Tax=Ectothiorhodospira magna TaxID=867345 RepID=A0A1H9DV08_9GAMM|nr:low molecular weight protein-tyrosine-phosphatase [Ectothiorhodospira magna]SEQ17242.1 protein-tyrosine phosphatase [Ectothiorhodospira magna]